MAPTLFVNVSLTAGIFEFPSFIKKQSYFQQKKKAVILGSRLLFFNSKITEQP
jgi:hypothetical protein